MPRLSRIYWSTNSATVCPSFSIAPFARQDRAVPLVLDLGCGTGLMGERLRPIADRLEGYDISAGMLKKARAKGVYDLLAKVDLQGFAYAGPKADLVVAADVFIYVGALDHVVKTVAGILADQWPVCLFRRKPAGGRDAGFALRPSRRYAHSEAMSNGCLPQTAFRCCRWSRPSSAGIAASRSTGWPCWRCPRP